MKHLGTHLVALLMVGLGLPVAGQPKHNILFIMTDDHAAHAMGAYGGRLSSLNPTPTLDALAKEGMRFTNCFVTNSICVPSRASILTGQYSQRNGVLDLDSVLPREKNHLPQEMKKLGYQTALIGKWHLGATPDFDYYKVMYEHGGQGSYFDPHFLATGTPFTKEHNQKPEKSEQFKGHSSDIITDLTLKWLKEERDPDKPFFLMHHYKAPHDMFENAPRYDSYLEDVDIPEPVSLYAQPYFGSVGTHGVNGGMKHLIGTSISDRHNLRNYTDILLGKDRPVENLKATRDAYQVYLKRYLRCVKGVDDNLARLFDSLKASGLWEKTIIIYTSDQGMMLGEHDYQDKRWMYEESIHMPFIIRHPEMKAKDLRNEMVINNVDFAPTLLGLAGAETPDYMHGRDFSRSVLSGEELENWDNSTYYRYWMHMIHHDIPAHFGIRTERYKLIFFYGYHWDPKRMGQPSMTWLKDSNKIIQTPAAWEFYDLERDPQELVNRYDAEEYQEVIGKMKERLKKKREQLDETDEAYPHLQRIIEASWDA
ncbi:MAG: sulfatase [Verrucomicrobiota bacterium]